MNIYLIRHGSCHTEMDEAAPILLNKTGVLQAKRLGRRLTNYQIGRIYTSDMERALQTSEIIGKILSVDILPRQDLREIDMGTFVRGWEYLNEFHPVFAEKFSKHTEDVPYPGGECGLDVMLRASNAINEILDCGCENVAVVTHCGTIRALLCGFLGLGQARRFLLGSPIEYCSISTVQYDKADHRFYVHTVNDYAHLETMRSMV